MVKKYLLAIRLMALWIWAQRPWRGRKQRRVNEWFIRTMESAAANGRIAVDFQEAIVQMNMDFYEEYLCNGAYTPLNDFKAHLFFYDIRGWINLRRGWLNGKENMQLPPLLDDDRVKFGVMDETNDKLIILGYETTKHIMVTVNERKVEDELKELIKDEGTTQE